MQNLNEKLNAVFPGVAVSIIVAIAAQFLSDHYGAPAMLMAILLGIALQFLSEDEKTSVGINFSSKVLLRIGVALLGVRISFELISGLGATFIGLAICGVIATIVFALLLGKIFKHSTSFAFLTGGAVAICGASAAMAIAAILPNRENSERDLAFTVVGVTIMSTLAMIIYPIIASNLGFDAKETGFFLGATIHDVAQVVGAGFSVSEETGEIATVVKLIRVMMLAPVVLIAAIILRNNKSGSAARPPLLPEFVIAFLIIALLNSFHLIPTPVQNVANVVSRWALLAAIAAVGMKTSIKELTKVGGQAIALISAQTLFLAGAIVLVLSFLK